MACGKWLVTSCLKGALEGRPVGLVQWDQVLPCVGRRARLQLRETPPPPPSPGSQGDLQEGPRARRVLLPPAAAALGRLLRKAFAMPPPSPPSQALLQAPQRMEVGDWRGF